MSIYRINLFLMTTIMRGCYDTFWAISHGALILKVTVNGVTFVLPPFGGKDEDMPLIVNALKEYFGGPFEFHGIYESTMERFKRTMPEITEYGITGITSMTGRNLRPYRDESITARRTITMHSSRNTPITSMKKSMRQTKMNVLPLARRGVPSGLRPIQRSNAKPAPLKKD